MTIKAHPLTWPEGWKRTPYDRRKPGHFGKRLRRPGESWTRNADLTVNEAVQRVLVELARWAIARDDIVISTNVPTRLDGMPRSDAKRPLDPGAAVYWEESTGERRCIAVDQYTHVEDNLAAIAATLDAMRAIERHGGAEILQRAFTGFTALPAPSADGERRRRAQLVGRAAGAEAVDARGREGRLPRDGQQGSPGPARRLSRAHGRTQCGAGPCAAGVPSMTHTMTKQQQNHGKRAPRGRAQLTNRLALWCTSKHRRLVRKNGGSMWVRKLIDEATS